MVLVLLATALAGSVGAAGGCGERLEDMNKS